MQLSVSEAATLLGRSPRAVRAQLARGDIEGVKRDGVWRIERGSLPLNETQRRSLQAKAELVRRAVEDALPSRTATTTGRRSRSLADMTAFRKGAQLLGEIRSAECSSLGEPAQGQICRLFEQALLKLAEAEQHFDRELKLAAVNRARAALARVVGCLLMEAGIPPPEPAFGWLTTLEGEVMPAVAGFARWVDRLPQGER